MTATAQDLLPAESWTSGMTDPAAIVNDNARRLEVATLPALSFESAQPGSPVAGGLYVLSSAWGDEVTGTLAYYFDGAWTYWTPFEGQIKDIGGSSYRYESGAWAIYSAGAFASIAVQFTAELGSTADSDPGAGLLKWNHAAQASATQIFVDDTTADGVSLTGLWAALSAGGFLYLQHQTDQDLWQIWEVTAVVDATGYAKLTVALIAKSTANFVDADPMLVTFQQGASSSAVADGTYGDITVSSSGTVWTIVNNSVITAKINNGAVTLAKQADMATASVVYRKTAGTGPPEVQTLATLKADLGLTGTNSGDQDLTPYDTRGRQAIYVSAGAMRPSVTGGCAALAAIASAANQPDIVTLDFDPTTAEYAQFAVVMPKKWDAGTLTYAAHWSHPATTTDFGIAVSLQAVAVSNDDPIAVAYGTGVPVTDTGGTTNDLYTTAESTAITVAGTPAKGDMVFFRLARAVGNAADTMAVDMRLHGLTIYVTTDASTDA